MKGTITPRECQISYSANMLRSLFRSLELPGAARASQVYHTYEAAVLSIEILYSPCVTTDNYYLSFLSFSRNGSPYQK